MSATTMDKTVERLRAECATLRAHVREWRRTADEWREKYEALAATLTDKGK